MIEPGGSKVTLPPNRQGKVPGLGNSQPSGQKQPHSAVKDNAAQDRSGLASLGNGGVEGQDPFHGSTDSNDVYPSAQDKPLIEVGTSTVSLSGVSEGDHPLTLPGSASKGYGVMPDPGQVPMDNPLP